MRKNILQPFEVDALEDEETLDLPFLTRVLRDLVRVNSVNPHEAAIATTIARWLAPTAAEVTLVESLPGRPSVGAVVAGSRDGPRLVLNGHTDTVPIDDPALWTTDPFGGEQRDGFLYGRGACDMKAGLTVQIALAHYLSKHLDRLKGSLVLHFAVGEERGERGTLSLLEAGFGGDFGITTEPTDLRVATAARGLGAYRVRIKGRSAHASRPGAGVNPLQWLPRVLEVVTERGREVGRHRHPLLGGGTCTPTTVHAGVKENAISDFCELVVDRRLLPGESVEGERALLAERLERIRRDDPGFEFELSVSYGVEPAEIPPDSPLAQRVLAAVAEVTGRPTAVYGTPFGSDVRNLVNDAGIEAITFGPGNVEECHCPDERISLRQLRDAALVTARVAEDLLT